MLAVKFYNLQALIHRPLLSPAKILGTCPNPMAFYQAECSRISMSKRKCVVAAQHTAKLLHNLDDKKSLVYGFPWWQMISCLICASSILLVASICVDLDLDKEVFKDIDWAAVDEDAEVCLKVCQALSSNSNAARLASDMMQRLKKTRTISKGEYYICPNIEQLCPCWLPWDCHRGCEPSVSLSLTLRLPPQGASSPSWSRFTLDTLEQLTLTGNGLLNLGRTTTPVGCAAVSAAENGTDTIADVLTSSDLFQATMPSQLDSMGQSQESFNLMFQTMPYEVSEPVMCKSFSPNFPDDDKGISLRAK